MEKGAYKEGEGLRDTDGVRELDQATADETGVDKRLGDPAGEVGSRAVDLGEVLSRESTTSVGTPSPVGVDDDLTSGKTGISLGSSDDEETGRLDLCGCQTDAAKGNTSWERKHTW